MSTHCSTHPTMPGSAARWPRRSLAGKTSSQLAEKDERQREGEQASGRGATLGRSPGERKERASKRESKRVPLVLNPAERKKEQERRHQVQFSNKPVPKKERFKVRSDANRCIQWQGYLSWAAFCWRYIALEAIMSAKTRKACPETADSSVRPQLCRRVHTGTPAGRLSEFWHPQSLHASSGQTTGFAAPARAQSRPFAARRGHDSLKAP